MQISNFSEVNKLLAKHVPKQVPAREAYDLTRIKKLMDYLGNPQETYKTIHISGTSGKTSTAYFMAALLSRAGKRVGMTVSPHVDEVNERLQIDLKPLPEKQFCDSLGQFLELINKTDIKPTYFELLIALAYWEFARQKVDYAVVEVGLGGLLDGTNVISRPDKVCIITDIGFDHTNVLGTSLSEIATQKSGIVQKGNKAFIYRQNPEVMSVVEQRCLEQHAELTVVDSLLEETIAQDLPAFQRRNWNLAYQTFKIIMPKNKLTKKQYVDTTKTYVPARMEIIKHGKKTIILDGAHNAQKMTALVSSLKEKFGNQEVAVLVSFSVGKTEAVEEILKVLTPITKEIIVTSFNTSQDMPHHSVPEKDVVEALKNLDLNNIEVIRDPVDAYKKLLKKPQKVLLITGSFYLLNSIRPLILK